MLITTRIVKAEFEFRLFVLDRGGSKGPVHRSVRCSRATVLMGRDLKFPDLVPDEPSDGIILILMVLAFQVSEDHGPMHTLLCSLAIRG